MDAPRRRINRNIVECKDRRHYHKECVLSGINRNIVECKVCRRIVV